jgi:voltage-gated potassium channel
MTTGGRTVPVRDLRERCYRVIFEADTPAGRAYDILLLVTIALSVVGVMLASVRSIREAHGTLLLVLEWLFTAAFTVEYGVRLWCARSRSRYALSFFGCVDLLGVIPTYLSLLLQGSRFLVAIRFLRMLRIFRVLNLSSYMGESRVLMAGLRASGRRITVFLMAVATLVVVLGSLMYVIEGEANGFTSIPIGIYWAVVTLTTVGYGDISPQTPLGQLVAAVIMILGYCIIVVPTGIVSVEMTKSEWGGPGQVCAACGVRENDRSARFCRRCGAALAGPKPRR